MTKQEYISHKIRILEHENKGRSHAENIAIAFSMWERGDHNKQQGGELPYFQTAGTVGQPWYNMFTNPNIDFTSQMQSPQQTFSPQTTGANIQGSVGNIPQSYPTTTNPQVVTNTPQNNMGYTFSTPANEVNLSGQQNPANPVWQSQATDLSLQGRPTTYQQVQVADESKNTPSSYKPTTNPAMPYGEWQRWKLANIYGTGLDTGTSLTLAGKYAGEGNTGMAVGAGILGALKGTRDVLTGYGVGKTSKRSYEDYLTRLEKDQPYTYLSETPLQATSQQGGVINTDNPIPMDYGVTPNEFAAYQISMQPVYNKAGDNGLNQLDYYKMLLQSAQVPLYEEGGDVDCLECGGTVHNYQQGGETPKSRREQLVEELRQEQANRQALANFRAGIAQSASKAGIPLTSYRLTPEQLQTKDSLTSVNKEFQLAKRARHMNVPIEKLRAEDAAYAEAYAKANPTEKQDARSLPGLNTYKGSLKADKEKEDCRSGKCGKTSSSWDFFGGDGGAPTGVGKFQQGGYTEGMEYELEDDEIQKLIQQGYKIRYV